MASDCKWLVASTCMFLFRFARTLPLPLCLPPHFGPSNCAFDSPAFISFDTRHAPAVDL